MNIPEKVIYAGKAYQALLSCEAKGLDALFGHQITDLKIKAPNNERIWICTYASQSVKITGKTRGNSKVILFAHLPNLFSNPFGITRGQEYCQTPGGRFLWELELQGPFQELVDSDGLSYNGDRLVWVLDYNAVKGFPEEMPIERGLEHPQTIPAFCGEARAMEYIERCKEVYGAEMVVSHCNSFNDFPFAQLLVIGAKGNDNPANSIIFSQSFYSKGRFITDSCEQIPSLEKILRDNRNTI